MLSALSTLQARCADIGLQLSTGLVDAQGNHVSKDKCEVILTACGDSVVNTAAFPSDFKVIRDCNFELFGGGGGIL